MAIDCENEVFTRVKKAILDECGKVNVSGEYVNAPSSFPHVSIEMTDCNTSRGHVTNDVTEHFSDITFTVNVYSNKTSGKKSECKRIINVINKAFSSMNFIRTAQTPVPNMEDATIYRITARYEVTTDGKNFYRR